MTDTTTRSAGNAGTAAAADDGATADHADSIVELRAWLEDNWDPDLTVGEWWERLGLAGWAMPTLPSDAYGRGLSRNDAVPVQQTIGEFGAVGPPGGLGLMLAAPTIATHGTRQQIDTFVRDIVTGQRAWCQLFSEPGAGSDLAGLTTKAVRDGDEWIVNGQKVWTSLGQVADLGMLLARTSPDIPKHQGITWFAIDMHQAGVDVRPLREMTGQALFNEVFLSDARVPTSAVIGDVNNGWAVANTTLQHERSGLGAGGSGAGGAMVTPGTIAGQLERRVGDFVRPRDGAGARPRRQMSRLGGGAKLLIDLAKGSGATSDPSIRQDLARLHTMGEIARFNNLRMKAERAAGRDVPGMANIAKLAMSDMVRLSRDLGLRIVGPAGTLHAYSDAQRAALDEATGNPFLGMVTGTALWAQAPSIYGGTDQVQRNIIAERTLGLPKEPSDDRTVAFSQLPKNA